MGIVDIGQNSDGERILRLKKIGTMSANLSTVHSEGNTPYLKHSLKVCVIAKNKNRKLFLKTPKGMASGPSQPFFRRCK